MGDLLFNPVLWALTRLEDSGWPIDMERRVTGVLSLLRVAIAFVLALALWLLSILWLGGYTPMGGVFCLLMCWIPSWWVGYTAGLLLEEILLVIVVFIVMKSS